MHTWQRGFGSFGPMTKVSSRVSFYCFIIRSAVSLKNWVHSTVCIIELVTGSLEYLIDNPRMFNFGIDEKPYIPHKSLLQWICCKCLAWWHRHSYFWPQRSWRLLDLSGFNQIGKKDTSWLPQLTPNPRAPKKPGKRYS